MEHIVKPNRSEPYPRAPFSVRSKNERNEDADKDVRVKPLTFERYMEIVSDCYAPNTTYEQDDAKVYRALVKGGYIVQPEE